MSQVEQRKYGVLLTTARAISFVLYQVDGIDGEPAATFAAGDVTISKDGGAEANITNLPVDEGQGYRIILTAAELTAARTRITIVDQTATKVWLDTTIIVETYGNASAQHAFDLDTANVAADVIAISGDSVAADNLEAMFDGTGYNDDTAPASRAQVSSISSGSAAISTIAASIAITTGTETLTYAVTAQLDGVYHEVADVANTTDFYYQFNVGGNGVPVEFLWDGYAQSNGDSYAVKAYNWTTTSWDQIGSIAGANGTTPISQTFQASNGHVGTGANIGIVRLQFVSTDGTHFATDRVLCSYAIVTQSVGYAKGSIWVDTIDGTAGTENYVNGTADNPCLTWADAITISGQMNIHRFELSSETAIVLTANSDYYNITGYGATIDLNGQSCSAALIEGAVISGVCTGALTPWFKNCSIGTVTLPPSNLDRCGFTSTTTVGSAGDFFLVDCFSQVAGSSSPIFDMAAIGACNISNRRWGGGWQINNIAAGDVISAEATVGGTLTLNGANGNTEVRGGWKQTVNNLTGSPIVSDFSVNTRFNTLNDFDPATEEVLSNVQKINDTTVLGDGTTGDKWRG